MTGSTLSARRTAEVLNLERDKGTGILALDHGTARLGKGTTALRSFPLRSSSCRTSLPKFVSDLYPESYKHYCAV